MTVWIAVLALVARAADYTIEAENGTITGCTMMTDAQYSGGKAVRMTDGSDKLVLTVDIATAGKYDVVVTTAGIGGTKTVNCAVNGNATTFNATTTLADVSVGTFKLSAGTNTITITPSWTWYDIDCVKLTADASSVTFSLSSAPVTSGVTTAAQKLYTFLKDNFGKNTVSGIMTGDMSGSSVGSSITSHVDVQSVYNVSGKYPALVGFDFMNATGSDVDNGNTWYTEYTQKAVSLAQDLWNKGGIPAFSWHWRDPGRSTDSFYASETTFDFTQAMNSDGSWNTSSTIYNNMIKDIDVVAGYLLQLQNAGVACIFRPLHEAPGAWFWWGAKGADAYKKLYMLVYDEIVNVKGVKNVIWDYNYDVRYSTDWCPDEQYYDIISNDIYNDDYDYESNYVTFDKLKSLTSGKKLISLSECGPVPDIDNEESDGAMWAHWMVWYNSWSGNYVSKTANAEWQKVMADSRVITLDEMPGWVNVNITETYTIGDLARIIKNFKAGNATKYDVDAMKNSILEEINK